MGIHNLKNKTEDRLSKKSILGVWNNMVGAKNELQKFGINFQDIMEKQVNNGDDTLFSMDTWCGSEPLKNKFPDLYQLERHKSCKVNERIQLVS